MEMIKVIKGEFLGLETQHEGTTGILFPTLAYLPLKKVPSDRRFEHICIRMKDLGATVVRQRQDDVDYSEPSKGKQTAYSFYNTWGAWCGTYFPLTSKLEYRKKDGIKVWERV